MAVENCINCYVVSDVPAFPSDGKCRKCQDTGFVGFFEGIERDVIGESQKCDTCHGSRKCQSCYGKGYIDTGIWEERHYPGSKEEFEEEESKEEEPSSYNGDDYSTYRGSDYGGDRVTYSAEGEAQNKAEIAKYCGLVSFFPFCFFIGPIAIVMGIWAFVKLNSLNVSDGKGKAIAGIILGALSTLFWTLVTLGPLYLSRENSQAPNKEQEGILLHCGRRAQPFPVVSSTKVIVPPGSCWTQWVTLRHDPTSYTINIVCSDFLDEEVRYTDNTKQYFENMHPTGFYEFRGIPSAVRFRNRQASPVEVVLHIQ